MTENLRTLVAMVVDRSGSMSSIRNDTIEGINAFLTEQKADPENTFYTYAQFDDVYEVVNDNIPVSDAPLLDHKTFVPRGMTALHDAIGKTVNRVSSFVATQPVGEKPERVILVVVTDGHENASRDFNSSSILELLNDKQNNHGWNVIYLAANQNAITQAAKFGVKTGSAMNFTAGKRGVKALYAATNLHVNSLKKGLTRSVDFTPQERYCSTADSQVAQEQAIAQYNTATGESVSLDVASGQATTTVVDSTKSGDES
jgi:hypothetical protein